MDLENIKNYMGFKANEHLNAENLMIEIRNQREDLEKQLD